MDAGAWLGAAGGAMGLAGVFAGAYAVIRSGVTTRTIELWKQQAEALEERLETEQAAHKSCRDELDQVYDRLDTLEDASETLASIIAKNIDASAMKTLMDIQRATADHRRAKKRRQRAAD